MKKTFILVLFAVLFLSCEKEQINIEIEPTWEKPSTAQVEHTLNLSINMANSELKTLVLTNYKKRIVEVRDRFQLALIEVEKKPKNELEFNSNMQNAIKSVEENAKETEGKRVGFSDEQNEGLRKYNALSNTSISEMNDLLKN